ncbi:MAG: lysostaphin resistance A-like protein [Candidatus Hermodarchaeota archaeon]
MLEAKKESKKLNYPQMELPKSIALHLAPGILVTIFYIIVGPFVLSIGLPNTIAMLLGIVVVIAPFEFGFLLYQARKNNHSFSFQNIIFYREPMPLNQFILVIIVLFLYTTIIAILILPIVDKFLLDSLFFWLPDWYILSIQGFSKNVLIPIVIFGLIMNGFAAPIIEELYFRGYLLPRLSELEEKGVFLNLSLHAIYHLWMPWRIPGLIIGYFPAAWIVWKKKNIYLSMIIHVIGNTLGSVFTLLYVLNLP